MLSISLNEKVPSVKETLSILTNHTQDFGYFYDYDRMREYIFLFSRKANDIERLLKSHLGCVSGKKIEDAIIEKLEQNGTIYGLIKTPGGSWSFNQESVALWLSTNETRDKEMVAIFKLYMAMKESRSAISLFEGILDKGSLMGAYSFEKRRMLRSYPVWSAQNTGRVAASNPPLQNITKSLQDIATVPYGYIKVETDSAQIEPCVVYSWQVINRLIKDLIIAYKDAYFGLLHYVNADDSFTVDNNPAFELHEITDDLRKLRDHFKTLGNAVNYGSTANENNDPLKARYIKRIGQLPERVKMLENIKARVLAGDRIFHTAFGTPIDITAGPSEHKYTDKGSNAYLNHLIRCAVNNPIQGTAADLMRISVSRANKLLMTKAPNSYILGYVHDAGKFAIREDEYDKVEEGLKEIVSYQVEDWIPIRSDYEVGRRNTSGIQSLY